MPKQIKVCRVCGNKYEACHTVQHGSPVFRWQDVACSPECGAIYLQQIRKSRTSDVDADTSADTDSAEVTTVQDEAVVETEEETPVAVGWEDEEDDEDEYDDEDDEDDYYYMFGDTEDLKD